MDAGVVTAKGDIWARGCVVYRIITGFPLFALEGCGSMADTNLEQIVMFMERLGPVPDSLRTAWADSNRHLTSDGHLKDPFPEEEMELPLAETIREAKKKGMGDDEVAAFIEYLGLIFRFEPAKS